MAKDEPEQHILCSKSSRGGNGCVSIAPGYSTVIMMCISIDLEKTAANFSAWSGEKMHTDSAIPMSIDGTREIIRLFREIRHYHEKEKPGKWNTAFFTLDTESGSFNIEFDNCKQLDSAELTLRDYRKRYQ